MAYLNGKVTSVIKIVTDVIIILCCIVRWYILRHKRSKGVAISNYLFALSVACETWATVLATLVLFRGDDYLAEYGTELGNAFLLNEFVLKVCSSWVWWGGGGVVSADLMGTRESRWRSGHTLDIISRSAF